MNSLIDACCFRPNFPVSQAVICRARPVAFFPRLHLPFSFLPFQEEGGALGRSIALREFRDRRSEGTRCSDCWWADLPLLLLSGCLPLKLGRMKPSSPCDVTGGSPPHRSSSDISPVFGCDAVSRGRSKATLHHPLVFILYFVCICVCVHVSVHVCVGMCVLQFTSLWVELA